MKTESMLGYIQRVCVVCIEYAPTNISLSILYVRVVCMKRPMYVNIQKTKKPCTCLVLNWQKLFLYNETRNRRLRWVERENSNVRLFSRVGKEVNRDWNKRCHSFYEIIVFEALIFMLVPQRGNFVSVNISF